MAAEQRQFIQLAKEHELRIEVDWGQKVTVILKDGSAEIFGTELALGHQLDISGQKVAIFSWQGCKLEVLGTPDVIYTSDETPMMSYLNCHAVLEQRRVTAKKEGQVGPTTFVVGPVDSGKSTLCKILSTYAVRMGFSPTFVDLDVGQNSITCPANIAATPIDTPISIQEGLPLEAPLVFYYGHVSPSENPELYKALVERLAAILAKRAQASSEVASAGMFINSMGWVEGLGYQLLLHTIQVDVVLVVGQERLYSQLTSEFKARKDISIVKLAKSGGVVSRDVSLRKTSRTQRVKEYFYGVRGELSPHSQTVRLHELQVYRVGGGPRAPSSALPIGGVQVLSLSLIHCASPPYPLIWSCCTHCWRSAMLQKWSSFSPLMLLAICTSLILTSPRAQLHTLPHVQGHCRENCY